MYKNIALTLFIGFLGFISFFSCSKKSNKIEIESELYTPILRKDIAKDKSSYKISKDEVYVYDSPNGKKIINQKATSLLGEIYYIEVDTECSVEILEKEGDWVKIHTIYPEWLQNSHNGWILAKYLDNYSDIKINETDIQILRELSTSVNNIYILYTNTNVNQKQLIALNEYLRNAMKLNGNIYVFDEEKAAELVDKEKLKKSEYLYLADHFISMSTFEIPKSIIYYPCQNTKYKELGGQHLKYNDSQVMGEHQFWVHVAVYSNKNIAENACTVLDNNNITSDILTYQVNKNRLCYKVYVGPYTTKSEAEYWKSKIVKIPDFANAESYVSSVLN